MKKLILLLLVVLTCACQVKLDQIPVDSVSLDKSDIALTEGDVETLTATVYPSTATNKNVVWTSSNTSVATVSGGTVRAMSGDGESEGCQRNVRETE